MEERRKNVKGITLIALVVTVVVLLILASISISTIMGENGLIAKAREAEEQHVISEIKEKFQIDMIQTELNSNNIEETLMEILSGSNGLGIYSILITPTDSEIGIKEIKSQYLFGTNGKIYFLEDEKVEDLNSKGLCDGRQIIQVNGHTYLDEENGIWLWADNILYKESDKLKGKTLTKQHGCNNVVMIIDSKGYLYKYGYYYYVD